MHTFPIAELEVYKQQLIDDAKKEFANCNNVMDKIILSTCLMRFGVFDDHYIPPFKAIEAFEKSNQQQFIFFQARAAFSYPTPFKQIFFHWSYINYYFYCPAYYKILWLENLLAQQQQKK